MLKHNGGQFYEIRALHTLRIVFPDEFDNLVLSDKPDLIDDDKKIGIEVVHPANSKEMELTSYYYRYFENQHIDQVPQKGLEIFRKNGYDVCINEQSKTINGFKRSYQPFDLQMIYDAIDHKVGKLNKMQYQYASNISLYLEMSCCNYEFANLEIAKQLIDYANNLQNDQRLKYKEIFFDCLFTFYRCNIEKNEVTEIDMSDLIDAIDVEYDKYISRKVSPDQPDSHT